MVRDHPLLSVLLACGVGCMLGVRWVARRGGVGSALVKAEAP
jgi:hypothetical protein